MEGKSSNEMPRYVWARSTSWWRPEVDDLCDRTGPAMPIYPPRRQYISFPLPPIQLLPNNVGPFIYDIYEVEHLKQNTEICHKLSPASKNFRQKLYNLKENKKDNYIFHNCIIAPFF